MKQFLDQELFEKAEKALYESRVVVKTPVLGDVSNLFELPSNIGLYLKLENMQTNGINFRYDAFFKSLNIIGLYYKGSFKLRGVINQFNNFLL